jgi:hypothetical protein
MCQNLGNFIQINKFPINPFQLEPFIAGHAESQLLNCLLDVDEKMLRIRYSETEIRADFYYSKNLYEILQNGENILAKAETFSVWNLLILFEEILNDFQRQTQQEIYKGDY